MNQTQICVNWESYLSNVSKGLTSLQKNAEFVDMTLAADGHLVKVHRNIVAIASPYLRAMLQSAPCQHPVIFLNNISQTVLSYILEYIYTGEVRVPPDIIDKFIEACKSLCIAGVEGIIAPTIPPELDVEGQVERIEEPPDNNFAARILINSNDHDYSYNLEVMPNEANLIPHNSQDLNNSELLNIEEPISQFNDFSQFNDQYLCENPADVNNIGEFIILKPETACNNDNNTEKAVNILRDELLVAKKCDTSLPDLNSIAETLNNICEISFDASGFQIDPVPQSSNIEASADAVSASNVMLMNCPSQLVSNQSEVENDAIVTHSKNERVVREEKRGKKDTVKLTKKLKRIAMISKEINQRENLPKMTLNKINRIEMDKTPHYSISSRGSLQMLLNRYLYNSHHHAKQGCKQRWRCIDYRKVHCPAYVDTLNDNITAMEVNHCHPNHDIQVRKKISSSLVYTSQSSAANTLGKYLKEGGS